MNSVGNTYEATKASHFFNFNRLYTLVKLS